MNLTANYRKALLTTHIVSSVGWVGAILAYLVLDLVATFGQDIGMVQAAFVAMGLIVLYCIVPLALASVLVGVLQALVTPWGLFRHYWVIGKLLLTLFATVVLLVETQAINTMAAIATAGADPRQLPGSLPHSIGGALVLLAILVLAIYKPKGLTRYGWRLQARR